MIQNTKLQTVLTLFLAVFGGTHALKLIFYALYPDPAAGISSPGYSQLFIALFVALLSLYSLKRSILNHS